MNDRTKNPFLEKQISNHSSGNTLAVEEQRAIAETQAAMLMARANPRDPKDAVDRIINACLRPTLANAGLYTYTRGGSEITGPSIRVAECLAQEWGNMQYGIRELSHENGVSQVQAYAWDLERNTRREMLFHVQHARYTKSGTTKLNDPRDIYEHVANQGARRVRACILGLIPGDVVEIAVEQCEKTMKASADVTQDGVKKLVQAFSDIGVTKSQIEKRLQRRVDSIQPAQVVSLRKIYSSLKDGMSTIQDWFDQETQNPIKAMRDVAPVDTDTGEIISTPDGDRKCIP